MIFNPSIDHQLRLKRNFAVRFLSFLVAATGIYILADTLLDQIALRHNSRLSSLVIDVPLLIGLSLIYLSMQLRRRKRTAWFATVLFYTFYIGLIISSLTTHRLDEHMLTRALVPLVVVGLLLLFEKEFVVKSDIQGFGWAVRFSLFILALALVYGIVGFMLLDRLDFHQEISLPTAAHYTVDQLDLTTTHPLHPYTKRARLFVDSLSFVSVASLTYA
ncbi:MAG: hypothetical protein WA843_01290, partial [Candidatus Saccharimonadales bacterium]